MHFLYFFLKLVFLLYICSYILLFTQEHYSINCHLLPLLNQFFFFLDIPYLTNSHDLISPLDLGVKNPPESAGEIRDSYGNPFKYSCLENSMDRGAWKGYSPQGHKVVHDSSNLACMHEINLSLDQFPSSEQLVFLLSFTAQLFQIVT